MTEMIRPNKKIWKVKVRCHFNGVVSSLEWCNSSKKMALDNVERAVRQIIANKDIEPFVITNDELKLLDQENTIELLCHGNKKVVLGLFGILTGSLYIYLTEIQFDPL